jgi:hypothetical protein
MKKILLPATIVALFATVASAQDQKIRQKFFSRSFGTVPVPETMEKNINQAGALFL